MCTNYEPPDERALREAWEQVDMPFAMPRRDVWPLYQAPFLAGIEPGAWLLGCFGLMPHWSDEKRARAACNARSETAASKPTFRGAWKNRQTAIIPAASFCEPNYESGKAVRWRIKRADGRPFGIAGLWERRLGDEGVGRWSFTMLTINADAHPLMSRMHKPGDEKRSIVILDPEDYDAWLRPRSEADMQALLRPFDPAIMTAFADPVPPRVAR